MSDVALIDINTLQKCKIIKSVKRNNKILAKNVLQYLIMNMRKQIAKFWLIYFLMFTYNALESVIGAIISTKKTWFNSTKKLQ